MRTRPPRITVDFVLVVWLAGVAFQFSLAAVLLLVLLAAWQWAAIAAVIALTAHHVHRAAVVRWVNRSP